LKYENKLHDLHLEAHKKKIRYDEYEMEREKNEKVKK